MILPTYKLRISPQLFDEHLTEFLVEKWPRVNWETHSSNNLRVRYELSFVDPINSDIEATPFGEIERIPIEGNTLRVRSAIIDFENSMSYAFFNSFYSIVNITWQINFNNVVFDPSEEYDFIASNLFDDGFYKFGIDRDQFLERREVNIPSMNFHSTFGTYNFKNLRKVLEASTDDPEEDKRRHNLLAYLVERLPLIDDYKEPSKLKRKSPGSPGLSENEWVTRMAMAQEGEELKTLDPKMTWKEIMRIIGWENSKKLLEYARDKLHRLYRSDPEGLLKKVAEKRKEKK